jgi:hypothetical protein
MCYMAKEIRTKDEIISKCLHCGALCTSKRGKGEAKPGVDHICRACAEKPDFEEKLLDNSLEP